jgi:hypothetical protein
MRIALSMLAPARVTTGPLLASSLDDERLLDVLVRRAASDIADIACTTARTTDGWPITMLRATSGDEHRIAAMYRFGEWRGYALVEFADVSIAPQIEDALRAASPDWRGDGEVHCIAELFQ